MIRYALLTLHCPSNVDHQDALLNILEGLRELTASCPVILPVHPRTQKTIQEFGLETLFKCNSAKPQAQKSLAASEGINLIEPLGYLDFVCLMNHASIVVTDSDGIQEETTWLGVPCVTVRETTERPVTVLIGTNRIGDVKKESIQEVIRHQLQNENRGRRIPEKWDGQTSGRIVDRIVAEFSKVREAQQ